LLYNNALYYFSEGAPIAAGRLLMMLLEPRLVRGLAARAALLAGLVAIMPGTALRAEEAEAPAACEEGTEAAPGLCLSAGLIVDAIGNTTGGVRAGVAAIAQLRLAAHLDLEKMLGLEGWSAQASAFGIYGRQPTPTLVGSLAAVSSIEALSTVRLFELWLERSFGEYGSVRFGQIAADSEFALAGFAGNLVSGTWGWPVALANTLPAGGPAYPLAAPGVRINIGDPDAATGLRVAMFSGNPAGKYGVDTNPQAHDRYGTTFSLSGGIFYMGEFVTGGAAPEGDADAPRPWTLKLGAWFHNGGFNSVNMADDGLSLANPASTGVPQLFNNNYGYYGIGEAVLWRGETGLLGAFGRAFAQPGDRNAVSLQLDGGLAWRGPFERRHDAISLGVSWARIGNDSRNYDQELIAFGADRPVRDYETIVELNYDCAIIPDRLAVRPLVQALFHPAAREPDDRRSATSPLPNAFVVGLRLTATLY
jgi:porin